MPVDQGGPAPSGKGIPMWVIIGGVVAVAGFLYFRNKSAAAAAAGGGVGSGVTGVATDPNTGLPIDPLTGLPYITNPTQPADNNTWAAGALAWAKAHGISPALANKAVYDYLNGNALSGQEADILNKILGGFGFPPNILPFFGTPSVPKPPAPPPKPHGVPSPTTSTPHINASSFPQFISAITSSIHMVKINPGGDVMYGAPVYALVQTGFGPVYEQGAAVAAAIKAGKPVYTLPQFAKYVQQPKAKKAA